ncbi:ABC transporter permease [Mycoplasma sp. Mirounga ES2805-ORL]|uniref:ABC transporter permease n=1 Tax=Mycoplasma sp. Mirounga ES2805-ORL TaxID=754514 RepID=UPI00197B3A0F|nr:ABC transporter permease [Mycoplasma sp. Mirounga ES2805-ORL]QSF13626.1 ABC transporter permease [Mycoplasma sp. Mirounga ES2805-ORL]
MTKYILKRFLLALLTILVVLIFSYSLMAAFITNPYFSDYQKELAENKGNISKISPILVENFNRWNDTSVFQKLLVYLKNFFNGDFGQVYGTYDTVPGYSKGEPIPNLFFGPLRFSIIVSLPSFVISAIFGVLLGIFAGYKHGKMTDSVINIFVFIFIAVPSFILAPYMIKLFGMLNFPETYVNANEKGADQLLEIKSLIPAIFTMIVSQLAVYTLYTRNQVVTVLTSNYVLIAKTKGLSKMSIFWKYVFRNISIPLAAIIIPSYIFLLSGSIIIERFWRIPGSSNIIMQAFPNGDINVVMFNIFFFTSLSVGTEIIVDLSYVLIDPRIRFSSSSGINLLDIIKAYFARKREVKTIIQNQNINNNAEYVKEGGN